jgi:hypothetical protein
MPNLFARAASLLLGEDPEDFGDRDVRLLLEVLGYAAAAEFPAVAGNPARRRATGPACSKRPAGLRVFSS